VDEVPFVSIIVPTRNRALLLEGCVRSLALQDYPRQRYEVVVVDDGSCDGTREGLNAIVSQVVVPRIRYVRSEIHGANAKRNAGVQVASGNLLCFVDDDVVAPPQWLHELVRALVSHEVELAWGPVILPPELVLPGRHRSEVAGYLSEAKEPEVPLLCNMVAQRAVFRRGAFDCRWSAPVEEIEWLLRTNPSKAFASDAWLWHHKTKEDCTVPRLLKLAWSRGAESGRFDRFRMSNGLRPPVRGAIGALRAIGHAFRSRCVGGLLVAAGRAGYVFGYGIAPQRRNSAL